MTRAAPTTPVAADEAIRAWQLDELLTTPGLRLLSLDCFDTLLWRQTAEPVDVFFDMQKSAAFKARGYTARMRALTEQQARQLQRLRKGRGEVALADIYRAAFADLGADESRALAAAELEAEKAACYAFPPVVELIRKAKQQALRVVIVSDTYFGETELRALLQSCLPGDVYAMIDRVFCSSDHVRGKTEGLFRTVLERMKVPASATMHLGDNRAADLVAPRKLGMLARHFVHQGDNEAELLRLQGTAASMLLPELRAVEPMPSPFRPLLALAPSTTGGDFLGYAGAGPILYSFARFVLDEIAALRAAGKRVKPLFLMRDGHLPQLVCDAVAGHGVGHAMAVSRRVAYAATFRSAADIERYLSRFGTAERADAIARQLLLNERETQALIDKLAGEALPDLTMAAWLLRPAMVQTIVERSTAARQQLYRYVERTCGLEAGDTLLFVDLGYEGTAQRQLEPVFREEKGVEILGRYLLSSPIAGGQATRKGLVDASWCDPRAIATLVRYIAVLENICTSDGGSVVGYEDDGTPATAPVLLDRAQLHKLVGVQARCVQFARDAETLFTTTGKRPTVGALGATTVGALGRLLFLPSETEVGFLAGFRLDLNMATDDTMALFDRDAALAGLRQRGLFFMEQDLKSMRLNYPTELRATGIELSMTMLAQNRYELTFSAPDLTHRRERVDVMLARDGRPVMAQLTAPATYDGCFALLVPMGSCDRQVGLSFGRQYEWLQLETAQLIAADEVLGDRESQHSEDVRAQLLPQGMTEHAPGLLQCAGPDAFLFFAPEPRKGATRYVLRVVFRPIARRRTAVAKAA